MIINYFRSNNLTTLYVCFVHINLYVPRSDSYNSFATCVYYIKYFCYAVINLIVATYIFLCYVLCSPVKIEHKTHVAIAHCWEFDLPVSRTQNLVVLFTEECLLSLSFYIIPQISAIPFVYCGMPSIKLAIYSFMSKYVFLWPSLISVPFCIVCCECVLDWQNLSGNRISFPSSAHFVVYRRLLGTFKTNTIPSTCLVLIDHYYY